MTHVFAFSVGAYRTKRGLSQEVTAEKRRLQRVYISALKHKKRDVSLKNVQTIATPLSVNPYLLLAEPSFAPSLEYNQPSDNGQRDAQ